MVCWVVAVHAFNPAPEAEAGGSSLVYIVSYRTARATQEKKKKDYGLTCASQE